jgi:hypothetical protein
MLLNLGSQGGPTDASSSLARKIDDTVGPGKSGIAFVTGNGGRRRHGHQSSAERQQ